MKQQNRLQLQNLCRIKKEQLATLIQLYNTCFEPYQDQPRELALKLMNTDITILERIMTVAFDPEEKTGDSIVWSDARVHNWHNYISKDVRAIWDTFTEKQQLVLEQQARREAMAEEWE